MPEAFSVDPRLLGKILLIQTTAHAIPTPGALAGFLCRGLSALPGVKAVRVKIGEICSSEPAGVPQQESAAGQSGHTGSSSLNVPIGTLHRHYGTMTIECRDVGVVMPYEPFLSSLANTIALTIENRQHAESLEQMNRHLAESKASLESIVEERTAELLRTNEELARQKIDAVETLASGVASEFRNILTAMIRSCQSAAEQMDPLHPARAELQRAVEEGDRGFDLVERVLAVSRPTA